MMPLHLKRSRDRCGYTLVEIAIVVGIIGLIMVISLPGILRLIPQHYLDDAVATITSECRAARMHAISVGKPVRLRLNTSGKTLSVATDLDGNGTYSADEVSTITISDHDGVTLKCTVSRVSFQPRGTFRCITGYWKIKVSAKGAGDMYVYVFRGGQVQESSEPLE